MVDPASPPCVRAPTAVPLPLPLPLITTIRRRKELLTPWMNATLVDFYFNVALLACWVWLREASRPAALFWIAVRP